MKPDLVPPKVADVEADDGFVFGRDSVLHAVAALQRGEIVLLTEDGEEQTSGSLFMSPAHATEEQLQFLLDQAIRPQIALVRAKHDLRLSLSLSRPHAAPGSAG